MKSIALDVHKRYTWARVETAQGERVSEQRVGHQRGLAELIHPLSFPTVVIGNPSYLLVSRSYGSGMEC